jgi:hypothetical protein
VAGNGRAQTWRHVDACDPQIRLNALFSVPPGRLLAVAACLVFAGPTVAEAAIKTDLSYENSSGCTLEQWDREYEVAAGRVTVGAGNAVEGRCAARIEIRDGDVLLSDSERATLLKRDFVRMRREANITMALRFTRFSTPRKSLLTVASMRQDSGLFGRLHPNGHTVALSLGIDGGYWRLTARGGVYPVDGKYRVFTLGRMRRGQLAAFLIRSNFSPSGGYLVVYMNGVKVLDKRNVRVGFARVSRGGERASRVVRLQHGIYRDSRNTTTWVVYSDAVATHRSLAAARGFLARVNARARS